MRNLVFTALVAVSLVVDSVQAEVTQPVRLKTKAASDVQSSAYTKINRNLRGWEYLAEKLVNDGIDQEDVVRAYGHSQFPGFSYVYFSLAPRESHDIYKGFRTESKLKKLRGFMKSYHRDFALAEQSLKVPKSVVGAILLVETHCGEVTGNSQLLYRLSRLASVGKPENLKANFLKLKSADPEVDFGDVAARAEYLERTFYPEIGALFRIAEMRRVSIFNIKGSSAGAFGIPQFLPTSYLRFARDGNGDGTVSLFTNEDAIWSAANYLSANGWDMSKSLQDNRQVIWSYNKSDAYIDTVLYIAENV